MPLGTEVASAWNHHEAPYYLWCRVDEREPALAAKSAAGFPVSFPNNDRTNSHQQSRPHANSDPPDPDHAARSNASPEPPNEQRQFRTSRNSNEPLRSRKLRP
jgi:hypothetical protein